MNMKQLGESVSEMGASMKTAASSAAAAAKAATDKGDDAPARRSRRLPLLPPHRLPQHPAPPPPAAPAAETPAPAAPAAEAVTEHRGSRRRDAAGDAGLSRPGLPAPAHAGAGTPLH